MNRQTINPLWRKLGRLELPVLSDWAVRRVIRAKTRGVESRLLPTQLALETVNVCNAECVMCPYPVMTRAKGLMTMDVFRVVVDKVAGSGAPINLITHAGLGEPLIDKHLGERLRYERDVLPKAMRVVYTNAALLTERKLESLLDAGLDRMSISFNGMRKDTYERVMKLDYDATLANVHAALEYRARTGARFSVVISCVPTEHHTEEEIREFQEYWRDKADIVVVPPWITWGGAFDGDKPARQLPCRYLWSILLVNYDGTVIMCCEDYEQKYPLGDLKTQSVLEVFNGDIAVRQRRNQLAGNFDEPEVCRGCAETSKAVVGWYWLQRTGLAVLPETAPTPAAERLPILSPANVYAEGSGL